MKHYTPVMVGLGLLAAGCSSSPKEATPTSPNILFILSDDHTSQAWGVYGGILDKYAQNENIRLFKQIQDL
jgi:hypothetical protein